MPASAAATLSKMLVLIGFSPRMSTTEWTTMPVARAAELDAVRARVVTTLCSAGWAVADAGPRDAVPLVWARALGLPGAADLAGPGGSFPVSAPAGAAPTAPAASAAVRGPGAPAGPLLNGAGGGS